MDALRDRGDFWGVSVGDGPTLQAMRGGANRVWIEVPVPSDNGSYGRHFNMKDFNSLLQLGFPDIEELKRKFSFQSWDGNGTEKLLAIQKEDIQELAVGLGTCFATDMITIGDRGVEYFYRETPGSDMDSGWRFFSGHESQDYLDDASNTAIYDVNTIANYDPRIIPLLNEPAGCQYGWNGHSYVRE